MLTQKVVRHVHDEGIQELESYFDRIRMAIVYAGSDPYRIREAVEYLLREMEYTFKKIMNRTTH